MAWVIRILKSFATIRYGLLRILGKISEVFPSRGYKFWIFPSIRLIRINSLRISYYSNSNDALLGHSLGDFTYFEPSTLRLFQQEILQLKSGDLILDIGAHSGLYGIIAMRMGLRVKFFEPQTILQKNILENIRLNSLFDNQGTLIQSPISADEREAIFYTGGRKDLAISSLKFNPKLKYEVKLRTITLDSLQLSPSLIKLDIEGGEVNALLGATETIRKNHPILFVEALNSESLRLQQQILKPLGYKSPQVCGTHSHDQRNYVYYPA